MRQMRRSGASLQQIGSRFGISREWVRRLLVRHYGSARIRELLTVAELRHLADCSLRYIRKLTRRGVIQPAMVMGMGVGRGKTLWKPETVATITLYIDRHRCRVCQRPLPSSRRVYCSQGCYIEANRYKNRSEGYKRRHREWVARWRAAHPEQSREIQQRSERKYQAKKAAEPGIDKC